jgi:hypothetical protein
MQPTDSRQAELPNLEYEIRLRAYEIYCARLRCGQPGSDLDDWLQAKRELTTSYPCESSESNSG